MRMKIWSDFRHLLTLDRFTFYLYPKVYKYKYIPFFALLNSCAGRRTYIFILECIMEAIMRSRWSIPASQLCDLYLQFVFFPHFSRLLLRFWKEKKNWRRNADKRHKNYNSMGIIVKPVIYCFAICLMTPSYILD